MELAVGGSAGPGECCPNLVCGILRSLGQPGHVIGPGCGITQADLGHHRAMLTVARRVCPDIEFHRGDVGALPFPTGSFDVVTCQLAMMFFPDQVRALAGMARLSDEVYQSIRTEARTVLRPFTTADGSVEAPSNAMS